MPMRRRPQPVQRPPINILASPPRPPFVSPVARTVLPSAVVPAIRPTRLPTRPISGHALGTILTIPTIGPLPTVPRTAVARAPAPTVVRVATALPSQHPTRLPVATVVPPVRAHRRRHRHRHH